MIAGQDYPGPVEIVLALGPSKDRTDEVAAGLAAADPRVRTVRNPSGRTPAALNAAIAASTRGDRRAGGRARGDSGGLSADRGPDASGGERRQCRRGDVCRWSHPVRTRGRCGDAQPSGRRERGVPRRRDARRGGHGLSRVFRRAAVERVGGFDEHFQRAQDWEMNLRSVGQVGGSGSPPTSSSRIGRAAVRERWPGSTSSTAPGGTSSPATTQGRSTCAISRRRRWWSGRWGRSWPDSGGGPRGRSGDVCRGRRRRGVAISAGERSGSASAHLALAIMRTGPGGRVSRQPAPARPPPPSIRLPVERSNKARREVEMRGRHKRAVERSFDLSTALYA